MIDRTAWKKLNFHPVQDRLWRTTARFAAVWAGRGSGKSELARRRIVRYLGIKPKHESGAIFIYGLPTATQARNMAWVQIKKLVPADWLSEPPNETLMTIKTKMGTELRVVGLHEAPRVEGEQYDGFIMDESSDQKPGVYERTVRPTLTWKQGWCWRIGVPKRFGAGAREFQEFCKKCQRGEADHAAFTWPTSEVAPPEEVEAAKRDLDPKDFDEQYNASWVSISGLVYYPFVAEPWRGGIAGAGGGNLHDWVYDPRRPIVVGSDFNVDPMAWVLLQEGPTGALHAFDEVWVKNTNTQQTLDQLYARYQANPPRGWLFFGDASGRARRSSASSTDYLQIKNDPRFRGARIYYPKANPHVVDRVAAVNAQLCNAMGERRLTVGPRCEMLLRDLTYLGYTPGSREIDERDPTAKHVTDALGYAVHYLRPIRRTQEEGEAGASQGVVVVA